MATFDVIFLGGGPAGYVGAIRAAQLGLTVAVIEREGLGGTCVLWGCIPAKALLESSHIANKLKHAAEFGVNVGDITLDYGVAMKRSRAVSDQNSKGVEFLFKKNKVTWIKGTGDARRGQERVKVKTADGKDGEARRQEGASSSRTGSRVKGLPQAGLELNKTTVISSDDALVLEKAPKTMAVVGAGAVGCEFADVFNAFGTKVTLIEVDADASCRSRMPTARPRWRRAFKKRKIDVLTGAKISERQGRQGLASRSPSSRAARSRSSKSRRCSSPPVARRTSRTSGSRKPACSSPTAASSRSTSKLETTAKGIYAIGDVAGPPMLAHKGEREGDRGRRAHRRAASRTRSTTATSPTAPTATPKSRPSGSPRRSARRRSSTTRSASSPSRANGRARTSGETEGFVKIIRDAKYGEILGAHIVGAHATELIHELARGARERVHGGRDRPRDSRAPDAVRGDRRGGAGLDGAHGARVGIIARRGIARIRRAGLHARPFVRGVPMRQETS